MKKILLILSLFFIANTVHAEIYQNIRPLDTLGDVKRKFPNAKFEKNKTSEDRVLFTITGEGVLGTIKILFSDSRPYFSKIANSDLGNADSAKSILKRLNDDSVAVILVSFIPNEPIPVERLISKYKSKGKISYSDEAFEPQMEWEKRGVVAYLTNDEKSVEMITFRFTDDENNAEIKKLNFEEKIETTKKTGKPQY